VNLPADARRRAAIEVPDVDALELLIDFDAPVVVAWDVSVLPAAAHVEALDAVARAVLHQIQVAPGREGAALDAMEDERVAPGVLEVHEADLGEVHGVAVPVNPQLSHPAGVVEGRHVE